MKDYSHDDWRDQGINLIRATAKDSRVAMVIWGVGAVVFPLILTAVSLQFAVGESGAGVGFVVMLLGLVGAYREWHSRRMRLGELEVLEAIRPLVDTWRDGGEINIHNRGYLHQLKELLSAYITQYRAEAEAWRQQGRGDYAAAYAALLIDLEDAKKLIDSGFVQQEREIRPKASAELEIEPAPLDQDKPKLSGLEKYRLKTKQ